MNTTKVKLRFSGLRHFPDRLAIRWVNYGLDLFVVYSIVLNRNFGHCMIKLII